MRAVSVIVAVIISVSLPAHAQQGPNFPTPGSGRGPAFPQSVPPMEENATNWVTSPKEYTPPSIEGRWMRWYSLRSRWGWHR